MFSCYCPISDINIWYPNSTYFFSYIEETRLEDNGAKPPIKEPRDGDLEYALPKELMDVYSVD
jgi:hypothetical protein